VRSKVGRGSTFWVELPLGVGHDAVANQQPLLEPPAPCFNHIEYVHGQALVRTGTTGTDGVSAPATPDGSGKGKEIGGGARSNSAMHASLMDQGLCVSLG
jgi:hypothetical protein